MKTFRRPDRLATWLALWLIALAALAPTVTRLLPASAAGWAEICTAEGMRQVALGDVDRREPAPAPDHRTAPDCPYCSLLAHVPVLIGDGLVVVAAASTAMPPPQTPGQAPRGSTIALTALARAPPRI